MGKANVYWSAVDNAHVITDRGGNKIASFGGDIIFTGVTTGANVTYDRDADRLVITTSSNRAVSGEEYALSVVNGGTVSSGDSMVGANIVTTISGTAASWVSALFAKTTQAAKYVNGYLCAAEFELQSTAANASDNAVVVLNSTRNHTGSPPACDPYILLREYGTTYANVFLRIFGDTGQGDQSTLGTSSLITSVQDTYEAGTNCAVRCMIGSTAFWLLGSTSTPTS